MSNRPPEVKATDPDAILIDADNWVDGWQWRPRQRKNSHPSAKVWRESHPVNHVGTGVIVEAKPAPAPTIMVELPLDELRAYTRTDSHPASLARVARVALAAYDAEQETR